MIKDVLNSIANAKNAGESTLAGKTKSATANGENTNAGFFGKMLQALQNGNEDAGKNGQQEGNALLKKVNGDGTGEGASPQTGSGEKQQNAETNGIQGKTFFTNENGDLRVKLSVVKTDAENTEGEEVEGQDANSNAAKLRIVKTENTEGEQQDTTASETEGETKVVSAEEKETAQTEESAPMVAGEGAKVVELNKQKGDGAQVKAAKVEGQPAAENVITGENTTTEKAASNTQQGSGADAKVVAETSKTGETNKTTAANAEQQQATVQSKVPNSAGNTGNAQQVQKTEVSEAAAENGLSGQKTTNGAAASAQSLQVNTTQVDGTQKGSTQNVAETAKAGTGIPQGTTEPKADAQSPGASKDDAEAAPSPQNRMQEPAQRERSSDFVLRNGPQGIQAQTQGQAGTASASTGETQSELAGKAVSRERADIPQNIQQFVNQKNTELAAGLELSKFREFQQKQKAGGQESEVRHPLTNERLAAITGSGEGGSTTSNGQQQSSFTSATEWLRLQNSGQQTSSSVKNQETFFKEQMAETTEVKEQSKTEQTQSFAHNRLGEVAIANQFLRREVLPGLTASVQKASQSEGGNAAGWQKHSFELDDGSKINLSTRNVDGVMQVKLASSSIELNRLLQQYGQEIKEHLEKECELNIDLQFEGNGEQQQDNPALFGDSSSSNGGNGRGLMKGNGGTNGISNQQAEHNLQQSVRKFGYNRMEWTA